MALKKNCTFLPLKTCGGLGRNPCRQKAHAFPSGDRTLDRAITPAANAGTGHGLVPTGNGARLRPVVTATNCRPATTPGTNEKIQGAISTSDAWQISGRYAAHQEAIAFPAVHGGAWLYPARRLHRAVR